MVAAKFVALLALLQLTSAWLLPQQAENFTFDNETANCSGSTLEEWLEIQPQPVFVDTFPGAPEPEEAEEYVDIVEAEIGIDEDVDQSDSVSINLVREEVYEEIDGTDDGLQDFIVNDDASYNRYRRDVIGSDNLPTEAAVQRYDSDESNESEEKNTIEDRGMKKTEENKNSDEESPTSNEENDKSEEEKDEPYAYLHVKDNRVSEGMLTPQDRVKVMLKNFQKDRMNFFLTVSSYDGDVDTAGSFASQPFLIKLKGCWLEHKHNAHKICKPHHGHGHGNGRGRGRGKRHHGGHDHHHGDHHSERHPLAPTNEMEAESGREQENNATFDFKRHKFMEPAEGEASLCSPTRLEGWLGPESKVVIAYSLPVRGCIIIRAYVSYPISNGSIILTSEGNEEYLEYMNCVDPNHIPEDDRDYDDYENNEINDDMYDDGIDPANIIDDDTPAEDDEDDSVIDRHGQGRYNLRPRQARKSSGSEESGEESGERRRKRDTSSEESSDEDSGERRRKRDTSSEESSDEDSEERRRKRDTSSEESSSEDSEERRRKRDTSSEESSDEDSGERRRRSVIGEELSSLTQGQLTNRVRRGASDDPTDPATNLVEENGGQPLNAREQRRQERKLRRQQERQRRRQERQGRRQRQQGRQGADATETAPEGTQAEGRRGRGNRRSRNRTASAERRLTRRDASDDATDFATNLVEETSGRAVNSREQRRQERKQRRKQERQRRRQERQGRQDADATEEPSEATASEGRRGRGRKNKANRRTKNHQNTNRRQLFANLTDRGSKFCCKQGIKHKKASTYPDDNGSTPALNCAAVPGEVPVWAAHKHPIDKSVCEGHYVRCCNEFDLELWNALKEKREARRAQRGNRHE